MENRKEVLKAVLTGKIPAERLKPREYREWLYQCLTYVDGQLVHEALYACKHLSHITELDRITKDDLERYIRWALEDSIMPPIVHVAVREFPKVENVTSWEAFGLEEAGGFTPSSGTKIIGNLDPSPGKGALLLPEEAWGLGE